MDVPRHGIGFHKASYSTSGVLIDLLIQVQRQPSTDQKQRLCCLQENWVVIVIATKLRR